MTDATEERRGHHRRDADKLPASELQELRATVTRLEGELEDMRATVLKELRTIRKQSETQLEIMEAWNNAKGFVRTVQTLGRVATWVVRIAAVIAALWALIHYGRTPPT